MKITVKKFPTSLPFALYISRSRMDNLSAPADIFTEDLRTKQVLKNSFLIINSRYFNKLVETLQSGIINPYPSELLELGELDDNVFYVNKALKSFGEGIQRDETSEVPDQVICNINLIFHFERQSDVKVMLDTLMKLSQETAKQLNQTLMQFPVNVQNRLQNLKLQLNIFYTAMFIDFPTLRKAFLRFENGLGGDLLNTAQSDTPYIKLKQTNI